MNIMEYINKTSELVERCCGRIVPPEVTLIRDVVLTFDECMELRELGDHLSVKIEWIRYPFGHLTYETDVSRREFLELRRLMYSKESNFYGQVIYAESYPPGWTNRKVERQIGYTMAEPVPDLEEDDLPL